MNKQADEIKKLNDKLDEISGQLSATSSNLSSQVTELTKNVKELTVAYNQEMVKSKKVTWTFFWHAIILGTLIGGIVGLLNSYLMEINASLHITPLAYATTAIGLFILLCILLYLMWKFAKIPVEKIEME